jgi:hypothetical protein
MVFKTQFCLKKSFPHQIFENKSLAQNHLYWKNLALDLLD